MDRVDVADMSIALYRTGIKIHRLSVVQNFFQTNNIEMGRHPSRHP